MIRHYRYRNPYDFVPLEGTASRLTPEAQARLSQGQIHGLCGTITFTLEVVTPLCIHHDPGEPDRQRQYVFAHLGTQTTLPATALKGMLRSVHEAVTNSTMGVLKSEARRGWYRRRIPASYLPGEYLAQLTPSEALFGIVGGTGDDAVGYAGRLLFADLHVPGPLQPQPVSRPQGGQPKPEHESFYFERERSGTILGRKFYYHQQDYRQVLDVYATDRRMPVITVQSVPPGTRLAGTVRFFNLQHDELAALVYTLILEEGLAHKLGYGKPLGLGSVRISITRLEVESATGTPVRFLDYGEPTAEDWTARVPTLRDTARTAWSGRPQGPTSYAAFTAIARWPQHENFVYPDFGFFRSERNASRKTTLWEYQGRDYLHPGDMTSASGAVAGSVGNQGAQPVPTPETTPEETRPASPGPRQVVDLRPIGRIEAAADGEPFVRGVDDKRYLLTSESAPRAVLRELIDHLRAGTSPKVRYRPVRQKIDKKNRNVARDVEPLEGS
jgi:CRISPR/Cas system CSM-associated protein Csm3 (group 7 of RAMP superfamily)